MTTYAASVDQTPTSANGNKFSATVGSGGVTAGCPVKWDGSGENTVVACSANTDACIGYARDTVAATYPVTVLGNHCWVKTGQTLTIGGKVEPSSSGNTTQDYTSGTVIGTVLKAATLASVVKVSTALG
jgi:hypothetical protein